jgi:protein-disulfide isomerase
MPDQQPTIKQQRDLKQEMKEQRRQANARQERVKNIITWSVIGLAVAGVITLIVIGSRGTPTTGTLPSVSSADHVLGSSTAAVTLIEYSDFECPACATYQPIVNELEKKYGDKIAVVYRYFPLRQIHKSADLAAQASEAAGLQGKFWEMHDLLFSRQTQWSTASDVKQTLIDYASELKLDTAKFTADLESQTVKDRVNIDVASGEAIGINSTPTFYLNGEKLANMNPNIDAFAAKIDPLISD